MSLSYAEINAAIENLVFFGCLYGLTRSQIDPRVEELIALFQLSPYVNTTIEKLSGGWQRRMNIAASMLHSPPIMILDEPTAGLDVEARYERWKLIETLP